MDEMREFNLDEVSLFCVVRDILKNFWVLILAAATAYLAVNGAAGAALHAGVHGYRHNGCQCQRQQQ